MMYILHTKKKGKATILEEEELLPEQAHTSQIISLH